MCCDRCPHSGPWEGDLDDGLDDDTEPAVVLVLDKDTDTDQAEVDDQADDQADDEEKPRNYYPNVFQFVQGFLIHVYADTIKDQRTDLRWCPSWWDHADALTRLEACWKAWEKLRTDPGTGASVWFRDHGDPAMATLTADKGPFERCSSTEHRPKPPLPIDAPPPFLTDYYDSGRPMS